MSLNTTPSGDRVHIGIFGRRNVGKSSLINAITGQDLAVVSDIKGTTTDPVYKAMELLPLGPVILIDTPGLDDEGELGALRVRKSVQVLNKTDLAVLVTEAGAGYTETELLFLEKLKEKRIPFVVAVNKSDTAEAPLPGRFENEIAVSALKKRQIDQLKEKIAALVPQGETAHPIISDLILPDDLVVLVVPVDSAAPKGRLILPQQQTIREILDTGAMAVVCQVPQLENTLASLGRKPKMVITDSQVFRQVSRITPNDIMLTSFSILFARHKGNLEQAVQGASALERLQDGDQILVAEGCTHHRQCDDIGTVKLPRWLAAYTGKQLVFHFTSGREFPDDVTPFQMVVHCGGCMLTEREMKYRMRCAADQRVPMTNYGMVIAYTNGILKRALAPFPTIAGYLSSV